MRKQASMIAVLVALIAALALVSASPAAAAEPGECEPNPPEFGLCGVDVTFTDAGGTTAMQAGSHPFAFTTDLAVKTEEALGLGQIPAGQAKELQIELPPGLVAAPTATPRCAAVDFATLIEVASALKLPNCSDSSVVGLATVKGAVPSGQPAEVRAPVYNLVPPPGEVAKFGFVVFGAAPVTFTAGLRESPPYNAFVTVPNIPQMVRFFSSKTVIWGNPSSEEHAKQRGKCGAFFKEGFVIGQLGGECPTSNPNVPFLTLPTACGEPLETHFEALSWLGDRFGESVFSHDEFGNPLGIIGCERLGFGPELSAQPTTHSASAASGLDVKVDIEDEGLISPEGLADSAIKKAVVRLPKGMTINPSQAEGLGACSEADFARETATSSFGAGCPGSSKVGTVEVESPLLEGEIFKGTVFVAKPRKNPFGTLIALYMTIKDPALGIDVKLAGKVAPDPVTGQIVATFGDPGHELPQLPFSHFRFHFREGARSPLITPPGCGTYTTEATFTPWADPASSFSTSSAFQVTSGVGGGPCPPAGPPPFEPGFAAGTLNNAAGRFSPFYMRLTRRDGDQDLTRFSTTLPPGLAGKLAGVDRCPEAQIAIAKAKSGVAELASPSCPSNSKIGRTVAGAGVGSQLTFVPGSLYLAGPYHGDPLSVVAIVPAVAGPFDVGTVVVRQALTLNPRSADVEVDGAASDPIPHILAGIELELREVEVFVDRPDFTLNPTGCKPAETRATLMGSNADVFSPLDDIAVLRTDRFQAASCAELGFEPRLALRLRGGTARGAHPALRAVLRPGAGDSNLDRAVVRLPRSAFLEQAHIRTVCTRVQYRADSCPEGSVYGHVKAFTPLLDDPLTGPVYLRSSNHNLPDLVFALHGLVDIEAVGRIDSKQGGIRTTFEDIPDAPISRFVLQMQGGKKGLIVNSRNLCAHVSRAKADFVAHNDKQRSFSPVLQASGCAKASKRH